MSLSLKRTVGWWCGGAVLIALGSIVAVGCGTSMGQGPANISRELSQGCAGVAECRELNQRTASALESCSMSCDQEQQQHQKAQALLKRALEEEAETEVREERARTAAREAELRQQEQLAQLELARERALQAERARERAHQRQLELMAAQADQQRAAMEAEAERKLSYFSQLTPNQRQGRLQACHSSGKDCENLQHLLVTAARSAAEKRRLIALHEHWVVTPPGAPVTRAPAAAAPPTAPQTPPPRSQRHSQAKPAQCCDGTIAIGCDCNDEGRTCCKGNGGECGCVG